MRYLPAVKYGARKSEVRNLWYGIGQPNTSSSQ